MRKIQRQGRGAQYEGWGHKGCGDEERRQRRQEPRPVDWRWTQAVRRSSAPFHGTVPWVNASVKMMASPALAATASTHSGIPSCVRLKRHSLGRSKFTLCEPGTHAKPPLCTVELSSKATATRPLKKRPEGERVRESERDTAKEEAGRGGEGGRSPGGRERRNVCLRRLRFGSVRLAAAEAGGIQSWRQRDAGGGPRYCGPDCTIVPHRARWPFR